MEPDEAKIAGRKAEKVRKAIAERDDYIRELRSRGRSLREIAAATGLSHQTIKNLTEDRV